MTMEYQHVIRRQFPRLANLARAAGAGRALLKYRQLRATGVVALFKTAWARKRILPLILDAKPIATGEGVEVHMLLNHPRVMGALWALYSLLYFLEMPCQIVIHDDGSLTKNDNCHLNRLFPGIRIISRAQADDLVFKEFARRGLHNCMIVRKNYVHSLKLFDAYFFGHSPYIIVLDSDILFYRKSELLRNYVSLQNRFFMEDAGYSLSLTPAEFQSLTNAVLPRNFNSGFIGLPRTIVDLELVEQWLSHRSFWEKPGEKLSYVTEQTIWAGLLGRNDASALDSSFGVFPTRPITGSISGVHYCGGGYWSSLFYWRGIPHLARILAEAGALSSIKGR
jgi:hypothetical protein